jgi:hypothetical protein
LYRKRSSTLEYLSGFTGCAKKLCTLPGLNKAHTLKNIFGTIHGMIGGMLDLKTPRMIVIIRTPQNYAQNTPKKSRKFTLILGIISRYAYEIYDYN